MLTALIRTHAGREALTERAIISCEEQGVATHVHYDTEIRTDFSYNLICNDMKANVRGFFFFLDSDDTLITGAVNRILPFLNEDRALIVQMLRNGNPKPRLPEIARGRIGLPCLILHRKHAGIADVGGDEYGDYTWIHSVCDQLPWKFLNVPLVDAGYRRYGK